MITLVCILSDIFNSNCAPYSHLTLILSNVLLYVLFKGSPTNGLFNALPDHLMINLNVELNLPNDIPYIHEMQSMLLCQDLGLKKKSYKTSFGKDFVVDNDEGSKNRLFGPTIIIVALGAKEIGLFKPST